MRRSNIFVRFAIGSVTLLTTASAAAETKEIGPGDDVGAAINALKPGDELLLRGGTYTFTSRFGLTVKGTAAQPIVVRAKPNEHPVFHRPNASQNVVDLDDVEHLTFRGIEWKGGSHGIRMIKARFVTIEDCEVHETADVGISANVTGPYEGLKILHNEVHHTGGTGEGMYLGCNANSCQMFDSLIAGNHVHHTNGPTVEQGDGIEIKEGSYNNVVRDNVIHDTNYPCILSYSVAGNGGPNIIERNVMWSCGDHAIQSAADAVIRNNIILSSGSDGIAMQPHQSGAPANLVVVHNTILKASNSAIRARGITGSVLIANNAVYAQGGSAINVAGSLDGLVVQGNVGVGGLTGTGAGLATGNIENDFVSAGYGGAPPMDVFTKAGSALLTAGNATHVVADDFEGRPRKGVADVGAYAFAAGPPSWPITADFKSPVASPAPSGDGGTDGGPSGGSSSGAVDGDTGSGPTGNGATPSGADGDGDGCQSAAGPIAPSHAAVFPLLVAAGVLLIRRRR